MDLKRKMKQIILMAAIVMAAVSGYREPVSAETVDEIISNAEEKTGLRRPVFEEVELDEVETYSTNKKVSRQDSEYWKKFDSAYIYNQLSSAEKAIWDDLENQCIMLAVCTDDAESVTATIDNGKLGWTSDQMFNFLTLFRYEHPQYWFLSNYSTYASVGNTCYVSCTLYQEFQNGTARKAVTDQFTQKVDGWMNQINACTLDEEKVKKIHDIIAQNTTYGEVEAPDGGGISYDQSTYSMVCMGKTVCAGYAGTFHMLANATGLPTIMVTSTSHAWNDVLVHGYWYGVDVTWDDNETASLPIVYLYYDKSNATLKDGNSAHVLESIWNSYVPALKYDSPASSNGYSYQSPYFTTTDYKYFIVNANSSRDSLKAYPVESRSGATISAAPARVTYNGKTYKKAENPINISTTPTPDPDPVPDTGTQKNGLMQASDGNWYLYNNNQVQSSYTGLYCDANVGWWYVKNGAVNFDYNGLIQNEAGWWCVAGGRVCFDYTGLWSDPYVGWWYVENGAVNFNYNGLIQNDSGWWCVAGGRVCFDYTGLWSDPYVGWWYVENGSINFNYNGLIQNDSGWWCVAGGRVCFDYTGLWSDPYVGWWYVENGSINFGYTGLVQNKAGWWYVVNGQLDFGYTGTVNWNGATYRVVNGNVVF